MSRDAEFAQFMVDVYALAGMDKEALHWLTKAMKVGFINYPFLAYHDPFLNSFRERKEFREVISSVKREHEVFNSRIEKHSEF